MKWREIQYSAITVITTAILVLFSFKEIVNHPSGFLLSKNPDALKNYYNFAYYLKYGGGLFFEGQNYPYGEHLLYTDSHPGLALVLNWIDNHIITIHDHAVGILNITMFASIILGALIIFLIARKLALPGYYAVILSLLIAFLSPQLNRLQGHFSLSHLFWIPLFLYGWWLYSIEKRQFWGFLLCVFGFIAGFIHPYYTGIYTAFGLSFWLSRMVMTEYRKITSLRQWWFELVVALLPLILIRIFMTMTDPFSPRPDPLFGFFSYYATPSSILLPDFASIRFLIEQYFKTSFPWEGRAYIGTPASLLVLIIVVTLLKYSLSGTWKSISQIFPKKPWHPFLLASFLVLLFSMCFPFRFGFEFVVEWFPQLKNFRALGRFSWVFFYVFTIYAGFYIYLVYRWLRLKKLGRTFPQMFLIILVCIWILDSIVNVQKTRPYVFNHNDKLETYHSEYSGRLESNGYHPSDFQAVISLPFNSTTGDKLFFEQGEQNMSEAFKCSWHTGLPLIYNLAPRNTIEHGLKNVQLLSHPLIYKSKLADLSQKPLLLVSSKVSLSEPENRLKSKSSIFWEDDYIQLASLPMESFYNVRMEAINQLNTFIENNFCDSPVCVDQDSGFVLFHEFNPDDWIGTEITVWEGILPNSQTYNFSLWIYIDEHVPSMPDLQWSAKDKESGSVINSEYIPTRSSFDVLENWSRIEFHILPLDDYIYEIKLFGEHLKFDRLLIKPVDANVLMKDRSAHHHFNNYPVKLN